MYNDRMSVIAVPNKEVKSKVIKAIEENQAVSEI